MEAAAFRPTDIGSIEWGFSPGTNKGRASVPYFFGALRGTTGLRVLRYFEEAVMKKLIAVAMLLLSTLAFAKGDSDPKPELLAMLDNFLAAASHSPASAEDKKIFNDFFADDVIYTRAAGVVITKADIMKSLDERPTAKEPAATYSSQDVTVHSYGDVAIVAFKLVQKLADGTTKEFRNTGTFITRSHRWQVIAWQATAIPSQPASPKEMNKK